MCETVYLLLKHGVVVYIATHYRGLMTELEEMELAGEDLTQYWVRSCLTNVGLLENNNGVVLAVHWYKENA